MTASILAGAAAFGFLGSFHCAFMCGPLACAGCGAGSDLRLSSAALYFGGRLIAYMFVGALFGALGSHLGCFIHIEKMQQLLLVTVAGFALLRGVKLSLGIAHGQRLARLTRLARPSIWRRAVSFVVSLVPRRALTLGLVTGGLPCGLLAGAWALAAATGGPGQGALVMLVFSAATAPALFATLLAGRLAGHARWISSTRWQGLVWCGLAVWIVARSLLPHGAHHGGH